MDLINSGNDDPSDTFVHFFELPNRVFIVWKSGSNFGGNSAKIARSELQQLAQGFTFEPNSNRGFSFVSGSEKDIEIDNARESEVAKAIADLMTFDISDHKAAITISPSESLAAFPFSALRKNGKLLVELGQVQYSPALSLSRRLVRRDDKLAQNRNQDQKLFGMALSDFEKFNANNDLSFSPLLETIPELMSVGALFPSDQVETMINELATEERIWQLSTSGRLSEYQYLLFSTHGLFEPGNVDASYVALNPSQSEVGNFDGMLTAGEVSTLTLSAELVFLSACQTGKSSNLRSEGLLGLPYSFFLAGAKRVIATLWSVSDSASKLFVTEYFKNLLGDGEQDPLKALHSTQLSFAKGKFPTYQDPRYWSGYVLYGG